MSLLFMAVTAAMVLGPFNTQLPCACQPANLVTGCSCTAALSAGWNLQQQSQHV
jgi:hypothetical protein